MARMRSRGLGAIVNSIKHFVPYTNADTTSGGLRNTVLINVVAKGAARAAVSNVEEGCKIFGSYVEYWLKGNGASGTDTQFTAVVVLLKSGAVAPTAANMANLQAYTNKKNILYTTQGVIGDNTTQGVPIIRDRIKIPPGKQRFGLGDSLNLILAPVGQSIQNCGIAVYKEFE